MQLGHVFSLVVLFKFSIFQCDGLQGIALVQPQGTTLQSRNGTAQERSSNSRSQQPVLPQPGPVCATNLAVATVCP